MLKILVSLILLSGVANLATAQTGLCGSGGQLVSGCASTDGRSVTIEDSETKSGTTKRDKTGKAESTDKKGQSTAVRPCGGAVRTKCQQTNPAIGQRDGFHVTMTGPVKISDLIGFTPVAGVDHMEPNGWSVVGVDTNFFATTSADIQTGVLLGKPASVRFRPTAFRWTYGDGSAASLTTGGSPWRAQGAESFDPTPTSHRYEKAGRYTIALTVEFGAEYRYLMEDWLPVVGTLAVPADPLTTTAVRAKTVLVARDCVQDPRGPGC